MLKAGGGGIEFIIFFSYDVEDNGLEVIASPSLRFRRGVINYYIATMRSKSEVNYVQYHAYYTLKFVTLLKKILFQGLIPITRHFQHPYFDIMHLSRL